MITRRGPSSASTVSDISKNALIQKQPGKVFYLKDERELQTMMERTLSRKYCTVLFQQTQQFNFSKFHESKNKQVGAQMHADLLLRRPQRACALRATVSQHFHREILRKGSQHQEQLDVHRYNAPCHTAVSINESFWPVKTFSLLIPLT